MAPPHPPTFGAPRGTRGAPLNRPRGWADLLTWGAPTWPPTPPNVRSAPGNPWRSSKRPAPPFGAPRETRGAPLNGQRGDVQTLGGVLERVGRPRLDGLDGESRAPHLRGERHRLTMVQLDVDGHALVVGEALGARAAVDGHQEAAAVTQDAPQLGQDRPRALVPAIDQRIERDDPGADAVGDGERADVGRDETQHRVQTTRERRRALREIDTDHRTVGARAEVGHEASDVPGGAASDVEHGSRRAGGREAAQPLDVPRLARQLVGEVG